MAVSGLRIRLLLLVLLALAPAVALSVYSHFEQRRQAAAVARDDMLQTARVASSGHRRQIEEAKQLLNLLAQFGVQSRDARACDRVLASILRHSTGYTGLVAATPSGDVFCSAPPAAGGVDLSDRPYFREARDTRKVAIGSYQVGRVSGKPTLPMASPVIDASGAMQAIVVVGIDLDWLSRIPADARLPEGSVLGVVDRNGVVLARHPDSSTPAHRAQETALAKTVVARREGAVDEIGADGVRRLYGFLPLVLDDEGAPSAYVWVGIPRHAVLASAERTLFRNLTLLGLIAVGTLAAAWGFANRLLARPLEVLVTATSRVAEGDLRARVGGPYERGELGQLGRAFDEMTAALETRESERTRTDEVAGALARVGRELSETLDFTRAADRTVSTLVSLFRVRAAALYRRDTESGALICLAAAGEVERDKWAGQILPAGHGVVGRAVVEGVPIWSADFLNDPRITVPAWVRERAAEEKFFAVLAAPLRVRGEVIGALGLNDAVGRVFTEEEVRLLSTFADQAALALKNAALFEEADRRRRAAESLAEVERLISQSLEFEEVGQRIAESVLALLAGNSSTLYRLVPESEDLVRVAFSGDQGPAIGRNIVLTKGTGVAGLAVSLRRAVMTPDLLTDSRVALTPDARARIEQAAFRAILAVPLLVRDRVIGVLTVGDRAGRVFDTEDVRLVQAFADQAAVALENARLYTEIKTARDFLQSIAENSADAIITTDAEGRVTYVSAGGEEIFGHRAQEMIGRGIDEYYRSGVDEARAIRRRVEAERRIKHYETAFRAADGRWVDVSASISALRDAGGAVVGTVAIFCDMTEQKRLAQQLLQSQKMEAVGQLAGGVAHDFNNLLTIITGRSHIALERLSPDDPLRSSFEQIQRTALRAAALTRQLLAFSRKQILQPKVLDLNAVVGEMEKMLQRLIGEDIDVRTSLSAGLGRIKADPGHVEQVLMNLVVNARDAMPVGGVLTVETANVRLDEAYASRHLGAAPGQYVMLAVSDTGLGMSPQTQARIFEPFFTTKERGKGTGLGLSTVYGIVKQSGGDIWVYSELGRGTTFKVYLPRVDEAAEPSGAQAVPAQRPRGAETILLAEDDDDLRDLAREILHASGYTVLEAARPEDALLASERHQGAIDLLVTDVVMPRMSGRELAQRLVATRPGVKVLYVSGYTDDAIVHHGVLDPGTVLLEKPFTPDALARKVREVLDGAAPPGPSA